VLTRDDPQTIAAIMVAPANATYLPRVIDGELDELLQGAACDRDRGSEGRREDRHRVKRRAAQVLELDDPMHAALLEADPERLARGPHPVLLDEWQRFPRSWDLVRRSVDADPRPGRVLLTGSAVPVGVPIHSGAGRILTLRMRPLSLAERRLVPPTVSLGPARRGPTDRGRIVAARPADYAEEIVASGFPAIRTTTGRVRRGLLDGYLQRVVARDFADQGRSVRQPEALLAWLRAYAAATATSASYQSLLDAAHPGEVERPARSTVVAHRAVLEQLWIVDPQPAWLPTRNPLTRLGQAPKHHLADPALAARLLGVDGEALLGPRAELLGPLFESLVTLSVRVYAQPSEARVLHLRTRNGDREVDLIVERGDGRVLAMEVKLSPVVRDGDVRHLLWLRERLGDRFLDAVVVTTGREAYRRSDGVAVVPAALLGP
jgi:uncharacterized protein